jgi:hypothetical protein
VTLNEVSARVVLITTVILEKEGGSGETSSALTDKRRSWCGVP